MNTEILYFSNPRLTLFDAKIVDIFDFDDEFVSLVLDRTCFFPRGGGARGDSGIINQAQVIEAIMDKNRQTVLHQIAKKDKSNFHINMKVSCNIDWDKRLRIMRLHSASHIMEHFLFSLIKDASLVGTNVNEFRDSSTYTASGQISPEHISKLNELSNQFIEQHYPIITYEDANRPGFRIWACGDIEIPCGGVHVGNTSEIGAIVIKKEKGGKQQKIRTELAN
jgi:alanyl-tRNA synthetase